MVERAFYIIPEIRAISDGSEMRVRGHAAVFNQKSEEIFGLKGMREVVMRGAFEKSIKRDDIFALWNHNPEKVLGRNKSGTLSLKEDETGLLTDTIFPNTEGARSAFELIKRGDVSHMSFGFIPTVKPTWRTEGEEEIRELLEVKLYDISPVTFPAYKQTDLSVRAQFLTEELKEFKKSKGVTVSPEFSARMKEHEEFLAIRAPAPDPYSLREIIKKATHLTKLEG